MVRFGLDVGIHVGDDDDANDDGDNSIHDEPTEVQLAISPICTRHVLANRFFLRFEFYLSLFQILAVCVSPSVRAILGLEDGRYPHPISCEKSNAMPTIPLIFSHINYEATQMIATKNNEPSHSYIYTYTLQLSTRKMW